MRPDASAARRPLNQLDARAAIGLVAERRVSAADLAKAHLARIAARDHEIGAFAHFDPQAVLDAVGPARGGALDGLLVAIKDNFDTGDMPTSYGSPIYAGHRPASDAAAVAMLRAEGAVVAGKTVTTEFAAWPIPVTRNPHRRERTPGGSSSGSAAAVADCMVPVALGTQTLGSVVRPASFCGIVGFKPSYGRISRVGVKPLAESLDTVGILAREVCDAELVYRVLSGDDRTTFDTTVVPQVLLCRGLNWGRAEPDARDAFESFVDRLRAVLAPDDWTPPPAFADLAAAARTIHDFELYRGFTHERVHGAAQLSRSFGEGLDRAKAATVSDYERAVRLGDACRDAFAGLIPPGHVVLTLSAPGEAPMHENGTGDPVMNSGWTLLHAACVTIPVLTGATGMPIGLQVVAPKFRDADALRAAAWLHAIARKF